MNNKNNNIYIRKKYEWLWKLFVSSVQSTQDWRLDHCCLQPLDILKKSQTLGKKSVFKKTGL